MIMMLIEAELVPPKEQPHISCFEGLCFFSNGNLF